VLDFGSAAVLEHPYRVEAVGLPRPSVGGDPGPGRGPEVPALVPGDGLQGWPRAAERRALTSMKATMSPDRATMSISLCRHRQFRWSTVQPRAPGARPRPPRPGGRIRAIASCPDDRPGAVTKPWRDGTGFRDPERGSGRTASFSGAGSWLPCGTVGGQQQEAAWGRIRAGRGGWYAMRRRRAAAARRIAVLGMKPDSDAGGGGALRACVPAADGLRDRAGATYYPEAEKMLGEPVYRRVRGDPGRGRSGAGVPAPGRRRAPPGGHAGEAPGRCGFSWGSGTTRRRSSWRRQASTWCRTAALWWTTGWL
jgi:hypothetical protein